MASYRILTYNIRANVDLSYRGCLTKSSVFILLQKCLFSVKFLKVLFSVAVSQCSTDELIASYLNACNKVGVKPNARLLSQLQVTNFKY